MRGPHLRLNRITGSSPLFTASSGYKCFPHVHSRYFYSESVLDYDGVARVMTEGDIYHGRGLRGLCTGLL